MKSRLLHILILLLLTADSPVAGSWISFPDLPGPGRARAVSFSVHGFAYYGTGMLIGFFSGQTQYDDFRTFYPASMAWKQKVSYAGGPVSDAYGFGIGHYGFVGGGIDADFCRSEKCFR